jgi:catechol 2,3-dioxygenase-like lactoylglutathione lyase family enzyme
MKFTSSASKSSQGQESEYVESGHNCINAVTLAVRNCDSVSRMRLLCLLAISAAALYGQLLPPNEAGVSLGHIHLVVPDVDTQKKVWIDVMGAQPVRSGALEPLKLPGIFMIITKAQNPPAGGTNGSVVNHVAFAIKDYAAIKTKVTAANLQFREVTPNQQMLATFPDGVTVELFEDKSISSPLAFHHIHESVPDQEAARAWYVKEFGAMSGTRRNSPAAMIPGGEVDFLKANMPPAPTKGRALDHIGFEVGNLESFLKKLEADGVTISLPYRDLTKQIELKIAFVTDPNGAYIELTEGLSAK